MRRSFSKRAALWLGVLVACGPGLVLALPPPGVDALPPDEARVELQAVATAPLPAATGPFIDVWYGDRQRFGAPGLGQRWVNVLGRVGDPSGVTRLRYALNGRPFAALSLGPDRRRLASPGDFNVEIDPALLVRGANRLLLRAEYASGAIVEREVTVDWERQEWPLPYAIDWGVAPSVPSVVQVVDGRWGVIPGGVRTLEPAYDRLLVVGDLDWLDYEIVVPFTVHGLRPGHTPSSRELGFGVIMRWTGHTDWPVVCPQPHCGWVPHGTSAWYWWQVDGGTNGDIGKSLLDTSGRKLSFDTPYLLKMRVETVPGAGSLYKWRVWSAAELEPSTWNATGYGDPGITRGAALIVAHRTDATIGNIRVAPLSEVPRPGAPEGVAAEPTSAFGMRVAWLPAPDDTPIVEYRVYRDGVLAGRSSSTSFSDQPIGAATRYRYTVTALGDTGRESAHSSPAEASTPPAPAGPRCGDGTRAPGEQCDDGDVESGDGCSALCQDESARTNALINGDFATSLPPWYFHTDAAGALSLLDGRARVRISAPGTNVQLSQNSVVLRGSTRYRLSFRARSLDGSDVDASLFKNAAPYTNYGLRQAFDLTPSDQAFSVEFVTTPGDKADARFMLWLAPYDRAGSEYFFDDFRLSVPAAICGDGVVDPGEACDDGDLDNTDECLNDCRAAACGDGWRQAGAETCDDGNRTDGDGCSAECVTSCGDGILDPGEACDDGNTVAGDGCSPACTREAYCGDGRVDAGETCDDGNAVAGDGCSPACTREAYCGDGRVDADEACDDGNAVADDGCSPACAVEPRPSSLVRNGDFSAGQASWYFHTDASAAWRIVAGESEIAVTVSGSNVQLAQAGVALEPGRRYRLSFRGRSSGGEDVEVSLFKNAAPYTNYGLRRVFDLTSVGAAFSVEFDSAAAAASDARLMFWLAPYDRTGARFWFDSVELVRLDGTAPEPFCGDGRVDAGEDCDDGNGSSADGCVAGCRVARCGDGFAYAGIEGCDDGNAIEGDGCSATCVPEARPNVVVNGDFAAGGTRWSFHTNGTASWRTSAGLSEIAVTVSGTNVQLSQTGIAVAGGARYRLRFRGRSSGGQDVDVSLIKNTSPYTTYGLGQRFDLTTTDTAFVFEFTTPSGDRNDGRLMFWLAPYDTPGARFWFDDVELSRIDGLP